MASQHKILNLYKSLIRESQKFASYNIRCYALRKIKYIFRENKDITDPEMIRNKIAEAEKNLEIIKRQAFITQMYTTDKLVIENVRYVKV